VITSYTIRELHHLAGRLQAVRLRLEGEATAEVSQSELALKVALGEASVALHTAVKEAEALAREQHHQR
jgi:hypothetical protein